MQKMQNNEMQPKIEKKQVDFEFPMRATIIGSSSSSSISSRLVT